MESQYTVTGMTCGHCVHSVTEEVKAIPGVEDVLVVLDGGKMTITSAAPIELDRVAEAVSEAGDYKVAVA